MTVGLGTGSTAAYAVIALARRISQERIKVRCVPTSNGTEAMAQSHGIPLTSWREVDQFDITIDGADEVDPAFCMIKGGGGALLREKIVAYSTTMEIIVVDQSKIVAALGAFPLPVVVCPFGWESTKRHLECAYKRNVTRRKNADGSDFFSDDGLAVLDISFRSPLGDPHALETEIKGIPGVLEVGIFVGLCQRLVIADESGNVEIRDAAPRKS